MGTTMRRILAAALTVLLTAGALAVAARTFRRKDREFKYRPFFADKTEYDVLFFGTSHVVNAVFPMQLWHDWGITSYNFGDHGVTIPTSYWIMRNAVRYHKPKVAVLDVHGIAYASKIDEGHIRSMIDIFPPSLTKVLMLMDFFETADERARFFSTYETCHNRWREMTLAERWDSLFYSRVTREKGADSRSAVAVPDIRPRTDALFEGEMPFAHYVGTFVSFCRENGIIPVLMNIPFPASEAEQRCANSARLVAEELGVPYDNMLGMDIVDYDTDCFDSASHLNPSGARKVTDYIGRTLTERYAGKGVMDRRGDPAYARWEKDYEAYCDFLVGNFYAHNNFKERLMLLNNSNFTARVFLADGVELDRVERKLVAQLGSAVTVERVPSLPGGARTRILLHDNATGREHDLSL